MSEEEDTENVSSLIKVLFRANLSGTVGKIYQEGILALFFGLYLGHETCFYWVANNSYQKSQHVKEQILMATKLLLLPSFPPLKSF